MSVSHSGGGSLRLCRLGPIVVMELYAVTVSLSGSWGTFYIGSIPDGFRPRDQLRVKPIIANVNSSYSTGIWIKPTGEVYAANFGGSGSSGSLDVSCTACWERA